MTAEPLELLPHQQAELNWLREHPRAILASETGTGKTATLLAYAAETLAADGRVLWVTEKGLVSQLIAEAARWLPPTSQPVELDRVKAGARFIVTTHATAAKRYTQGRLSGADLLVIDEAAIVKSGGINPDAPVYVGLRGLSEDSKRSVVATATPSSEPHALDVLALLEVGQIPGRPTRAEIQRHLLTSEMPTPRGYSVTVVNGIDEQGLALITEPLRRYAMRTTVEETGQTLPTITQSFINVPLGYHAQRKYDAAAQVGGLDGHLGQQAAARESGALVPATVSFLLDDAGVLHRKAVVFSENFDLVRPLVQALTERGATALLLDGSQTAPQRRKVIDQHLAADRAILVGTSALETGLNLQHASLLVSVVQSWNPARERQREGRLVRIGSPHSEVQHVVIRPNVSMEARRLNRHAERDYVAEQVINAIPSPTERLINA